MNITDELFVLPDEKNFILYAPLLRIILKVSPSVLTLLMNIKYGRVIYFNQKELGIVNYLKTLKIIDYEDQLPPIKTSINEFRPTKVTFLPTTDCNLRCIYYYSNSGNNSKYLSIDIAKSAIDLVFRNAIEQKVNQVQVGFLGGGEPFMAWDLMKNIVDYAKLKSDSSGISVEFGGVTNGVLSKNKLLWIKDNFNSLSVSFDGMRSIQDTHRPTKNRKSSYDLVTKTLNYLNETDIAYSVRSTISSFSLNQMEEIVEYLISELHVKRIHFEPLFACGRCKTNTKLVPDVHTFIDNYKKCLPIANSSDVVLICSAIRLDALTATFCGALGENFYITPEGFVTSCTEVSSPDETLSKFFFIGKYDQESKGFIFNKNRIDFLSTRNVYNMNGCRNCIAKWHCAGGCPAKSIQTGELFNSLGTDDCQIARDLTEYYVRTLAQEKNIDYPQIKIKNITNQFPEGVC